MVNYALRPKLEPRGWQAEALAQWLARFRGVVKVVTGGGKTVFAQMCMLAFWERHPAGRVVIVVPTVALLDQWVVSLTEDLGASSDLIRAYGGGERSDVAGPLNVAVVNSARSLSDTLSSGGPCMLVVDECHRAGSVQNALALRGEYAAALGLSATPEREYDDGFEARVQPVLGPVVYEYDYVAAARDGVITPFSLHNIRVPMLADEEASFDSLSRSVAVERARLAAGDGSEDRLARLLQRRAAVVATAQMRIPVAVRLAEAHIGQRTIIFHERVSAANAVLGLLKNRSRSATIYHASVPPVVRRDNLRLYRRGVYDILVCCRALDEGINVPETTVAVIASATASGRQRVQRLGRALRPAPGKESAIIYTIYASDAEEERLAREAQILGDVCEVSWSKVRDSDGARAPRV